MAFLHPLDFLDSLFCSECQRGKTHYSQLLCGQGGGFLQQVDYTRNIKGWLTAINNAALDDGENDLFGMEFIYHDAGDMAALNPETCYTGRIEGIKWQTAHNTSIRGYGYSYDEMGRLTGADYGEYDAGWTNFPSKYSVRNITYDPNGNILTLDRDGEDGAIDLLSYSYFDNSNQLKMGYFDGSSSTGQEFYYDDNGR